MADGYVGTCSITDGTFGEAEYFQGLVDNVNDMSKSNDWFLLANDFASYMDAQKEVDQVSRCSSCMLYSPSLPFTCQTHYVMTPLISVCIFCC